MLAAVLVLSPAHAGPNVGPGIDPDRPLSSLQVSRWTLEDGLPANSLLKIGQSSDGYLWISSFSGLARFDGISFEVYNRSNIPGLATDGFAALVRDRLDRFWIGTRGAGLWRYQGGRIERFGPPLGHPAAVYTMLSDQQDRIWIGLDDSGVFRLDHDRWVPTEHEPLQHTTVGSIVQGSDGAIWFGTFGNGLIRLRGDELKVFDTSTGMPSDEVSILHPCHDGTLWAGTRKGLVRIAGDRVERLPELADQSIAVLTEDRRRSLWIGTGEGIWRRAYRTGTIESLPQHQDTPLLGVSGMAEDREGSIWFTTFAAGLFQIRDSKFRNLGRREGLAADLVESIGQVGDDYWIGTHVGVVNVLSGSKLETLALSSLQPSSRIRHIYQDSQQVAWVSSDAGLLRWQDGKERLLTSAHGLPAAHIRQAYEDSSGRLWVGTGDGLAQRIGPGSFRIVELEPKAGSTFVMSLSEDLEGNLLVATRRSLVVLKPEGEQEIFTAEQGLPGSALFSTLTDSDGSIWLATNGGLGRLQHGEIRHIGRRRGMPVESVYDLKLDDQGALWMSSAIGVIRADRQALVDALERRIRSVETELFDHHDGMSHRECIGARKILQDTDGRLWFPTLGGVSILDPKHLPVSRVPPLVSITGLEVDGVRQPNLPEHLIDPGHRLIVIEFSAPSFVAPRKMKVRYRLAPFDPDWTEAGEQRRVRYTNLPHGRYTFQVEAANADGVWNEEEARLELIIHPHFHQTYSFYMGLSTLAMVVVFVLFRWRTRAVHRRNRALQKNIEQRERHQNHLQQVVRELEAKNKDLEQLHYSFSHDLKTPLVTIEGFLGLLEEDVAQGRHDRMEEDIGRVRAAAGRMNRLLNGLRELLVVGRRDEPLEFVPFHELAEQAVEKAHLPEGTRVVIQAPMPVVHVHRRPMLRMLVHLLDNAGRFHHPSRPARIQIGYRETRGRTELFVEDDGIGIDPAHHEKVFGLFDRLDPRRDGVGIGLVVAERVVRRHGGRLWVESEGQGHGATFCFTLKKPAEDAASNGDAGESPDAGHTSGSEPAPK